MDTLLESLCLRRYLTVITMNTIHLTSDEKFSLLRLARSTLNGWAGLPSEPVQLPNRLREEKRGAFVTLRIEHNLRGCIGYVEPISTIEEAVRELSVKAASEDPRFDPVTIDELASLNIEISILTPLEPLTDIKHVEIGRHGLVVEAGWSRGLLLPEVAVENGWDQEEFLSHCCLKAGLSKDAWRRAGTRLFRFESEHFAESGHQSDQT